MGGRGGPDGVPGWPYLLYSTLLYLPVCLSVCLFWAGCMWETGRGVAKLGFEGLLGHVGCENATCGWWVGGWVCVPTSRDEGLLYVFIEWSKHWLVDNAGATYYTCSAQLEACLNEAWHRVFGEITTTRLGLS